MPELGGRPATRAGARPADLTAPVLKAMRDEERRLESIEDPAARIRAVNDFFAGMDPELHRIAAVRYRAIAVMLGEGMSQAAVGQAVGLVKQRIGQIWKDRRFQAQAAAEPEVQDRPVDE